MPPVLIICILIVITGALPIAWFVADLRASPPLRRAIGIVTICWSFGVAALFGSIESLNANAYFTAASEKLLEKSVQNLKAGRQEAVLREWSRANERFGTTYESRGQYSEIIDEAVKGMERP